MPNYINSIGTRDYQIAAIDRLRAKIKSGASRIVLVSPTGCHAKGQSILMTDGSTKPVEDILPGDSVMGPDSRPRQVLGLCRGEDEMLNVRPVKGSPFIVNQNHLLSLIRTNEKPGSARNGNIIDITVRDWIKSTRTFKHVHKLFRAQSDFEQSDSPLLLDPYFVGVLLGDGSLNGGVSISKPDPEIRDLVYAQAQQFGLNVTESHSRPCVSYAISGPRSAINPIMWRAEEMGMRWKTSSNKRVPFRYVASSRDVRLAVLAGLLDTDGHLSVGMYDFISKSPGLADDVVFLARSLGLAAYVRACEKYAQTGSGGIYHRVSISGDLDIIPCRIPRKQAKPREQVKSVLRTGFSVEHFGRGEFYGFTVDGDGRYLMGDFTVTHNSGKTWIAGEMIRSASDRGKRILFLAHRRELIQQCSRRLDAIGIDHGIIQATNPRRKPWLPVHVASVPTLIKRKPPAADLIFIDEAHRSASPSYKKIIDMYPHAAIIGLTATPCRADGRGLDMYEDLVDTIPISELIDRGYLVPIRIFAPSAPDMSGVKITGGDYQKDQLAAVCDKAKLIGDVVQHWQKIGRGRQTICFAAGVDHSRHIVEQFAAAGVRAEHLDGETPDEKRDAILKRLENGRTQVVSNVGVLTEGFDCPIVSCVIMARPTASLSLYLQMAGRALRTHPDKSDCLILDHAGNVAEHGFPDEDREWDLAGTTGRRKSDADRAIPVATCKKCFFTWDRRKSASCPGLDPDTGQVCGWIPPLKPREIQQVEGELEELDRENQARYAAAKLAGMPRFEDLVNWHVQTLERGYKRGYPVVQFQKKYGTWPTRNWNTAALVVAKERAVVQVPDTASDALEIFA